MWTYDKKLQYPVNIKQTNPKLAKAIITQYGGAYSVVYEHPKNPHSIRGLAIGNYFQLVNLFIFYFY